MDNLTTYLIEGCRQRKHAAQLALYKQHAQRLYATCYRIIGKASDAEEAMQDAFLKILTRIDQFHTGLCFEAWMQRIAIHTAIDYIRKQSPEMEEFSDHCTETLPEEEPDDETILYSVQKIKEGMQRLPDGYRIILSLYLFEGYDMEEISSILKIKQVTVRTQYLRAKKKLLELIHT